MDSLLTAFNDYGIISPLQGVRPAGAVPRMKIFYHLRRAKGFYLPPLLCFGAIILDYRHTAKWKSGELPSEVYLYAPLPPRKGKSIDVKI